MNITRPRLATAILLLTTTPCLAWGYDGHRIVGEIATHYLTAEAKAAVKDL
ncbi:MAG: S1/P1 Nuclease, partial [Planctomycetes bacterium]|nr:S1/P1 Nuclease [Planctomycetota bacterium]